MISKTVLSVNSGLKKSLSFTEPPANSLPIPTKSIGTRRENKTAKEKAPPCDGVFSAGGRGWGGSVGSKHLVFTAKRLNKICISIFTIFSFFVATANAQVTASKNSNLSALFFGDYYWFVSNHSNEIEGNNGFWIRRIYLTYDRQISDSFSGRIRLEMASEGDFVTNAPLVPQVKDAWIKWSSSRHQIMAGIAPTPSFGLVEEVWGYRAVVKSPLDLQDMASSRGLGVSFKGEIGTAQRFGYHFMVANGNGSSTELNEGKKFMLALSYELSENYVAQMYGDYETKEGSRYIYTMQGFVGYQSEAFNLGALYAHQFQNAVLAVNDIQLSIASVFTNFDIAKNVRGYFRVDHIFEPNPVGEEIDYIPFSDETESTFLVGGIDLQLHPKVHLLPNVEAVFYGENKFGISPETDLIARLTLLFTL